jgi:hypothetical protein
VELISRIMHRSIPFDPERRLEAVSAGLEAKQDDKIERLKPALLSLRLGPTSGESRWLPDLVGSRTASWHILVLDRTESWRERELVLGGERTAADARERPV